MPSEAAPEAAATLRLHPASLLFGVGSAARQLLVPGLIALLAFGRGQPEFWAAFLFLPAVVATLVRYVVYRYRLGADELVIREGIVTRNERHIPYARIQNIDLSQNPLHRLLGVAEVRVETAAGDKPEAVMRVLSLAAVRRMRDLVFAGRTPAGAGVRSGANAEMEQAPTVVAPPHELLRLPAREVLLYGLISNRGMVVVAAAVGALWQFDVVERLGLDATRWYRYLPLDDLQAHPVGTALFALAALGSLLVLVRLLSVGLALTRLSGFRLTLRGDDLRARYGLFTRVTKTIPRHRIQRVTLFEGPLHRLFGRVALRAQTAGGGGSAEEGSATDRVELAPLVGRAQANGLVAEVLGGVDPATLDWQPLAPGARRRIFRRSLRLVVVVTAAVAAGTGWWGLLTIPALLPLAWWSAGLRARHAGWAVTEGAVAWGKSGFWVRRASIARFGKIQVVELRESPFDRYHGMATLAVDTAGGGTLGHPIALSLIEAGVARRLFAELGEAAGRTAFRW